MTDNERPKKSAWRWPQLIAVVVIVVVLIGMITPVLCINVHVLSRASQCWKNQSHILGTLMAYAASEEVPYPWPINQVPGTVTDAHGARIVTAQMFGILSRSLTIPPSLFSCPSSSFPKISKFDGTHPPITWAIEPGSAIYALDWSAPSDSPSSRVVMADRDPTAHNGVIMAVYGDAHVARLKLSQAIPQRADGILITEGADGKSISVSSVLSNAAHSQTEKKALIPDDIYTNEGDSENGSQPLVPAKGHPQRAWVK